ncbi:hypothetical protein GCM10008937_01050 [Deinococcus depolymerans]|uniref:Uncharacterized protein n=1 Tax=Deinococcus depolymerans TaxID=392408 RepID=A0ABP3LCE8_9DEIO
MGPPGAGPRVGAVSGRAALVQQAVTARGQAGDGAGQGVWHGGWGGERRVSPGNVEVPPSVAAGRHLFQTGVRFYPAARAAGPDSRPGLMRSPYYCQLPPLYVALPEAGVV